MNREQAMKVLSLLRSAYKHEFTPEAADAWFHSVLESIDYPLAMSTVEKIVQSDKFCPTPARFNEFRRSIEPDRRKLREPYVVVTPEREKYWREKCKQTLAEARKQGKGIQRV